MRYTVSPGTDGRGVSFDRIDAAMQWAAGRAADSQTPQRIYDRGRKSREIVRPAGDKKESSNG